MIVLSVKKRLFLEDLHNNNSRLAIPFTNPHLEHKDRVPVLKPYQASKHTAKTPHIQRVVVLLKIYQ